MKKSLVAVVVVALVAMACGGNTFSREKSIEELEEDFGLTETQAVCVTDTVIDEIGLDRLEELVNDAEVTGAEAASLIDAFDACGTGASAVVDTDDITAFATELGVTEDVARCVFDDLGAELAELGATGAEPSDALIERVFASISGCGG